MGTTHESREQNDYDDVDGLIMTPLEIQLMGSIEMRELQIG